MCVYMCVQISLCKGLSVEWLHDELDRVSVCEGVCISVQISVCKGLLVEWLYVRVGVYVYTFVQISVCKGLSVEWLHDELDRVSVCEGVCISVQISVCKGLLVEWLYVRVGVYVYTFVQISVCKGLAVEWLYDDLVSDSGNKLRKMVKFARKLSELEPSLLNP